MQKNGFDIFNMVDFFQIFIPSANIKILIVWNFSLEMYVPYTL